MPSTIPRAATATGTECASTHLRVGPLFDAERVDPSALGTSLEAGTGAFYTSQGRKALDRQIADSQLVGMCLMYENMGRYIEMTMTPTPTPITTVSNGSSRDVRLFTVASTSAS